jgi:hypothetical protein
MLPTGLSTFSRESDTGAGARRGRANADNTAMSYRDTRLGEAATGLVSI